MRSFQNPPNPDFYVIAITWLIIFLGFDSNRSYAQFTKNDEASTVIQDMAGTKADWGDFDNDGDLDLAVVGSHGGKFAKIYRNNNGTLEDIEAELQGISGYGNAMWGDFDGDLDLDLVITGSTSVGVFPDQQDINIAYVYRNDNGVFVNQEANLTGVAGWAQWNDYDGDGDLDLAVVGTPTDVAADGTDILDIYNNDDGTFTSIDVPNLFVRKWTGASIDWGDYDNDGDNDLFVSVTGEVNKDPLQWKSVVLSNNEGSFTAVDLFIPGVFSGHVKWADYDVDGDLDLAMMGINYQDEDFTTVFNNNDGIFTDIGFDFGNNSPDTKCAWGFLDWEDYDTDGYPDLLVSGKQHTGTFITKVLRNEEGVFSDMHMPLPGTLGYAIWGDYDDDFDLDVLVGGVQKVGDRYYNLTELYTNEIRTAHTILFETIGEKTYGDAKFDLSAESSAAQEVKFNVISGPVTLENKSISIHGTGEVVVRAYHAGNETYNPSYAEWMFLVKKAILTATANNESIIFGDAIPELGISYGGFVNGDDVTDLLEAPELSTTASAESPVGTYTINISGGQSKNYELILVDGELTITTSILDVDAHQKKVMAYPNPVHQVLTIPEADGLQLKFYNLSGEQLYIKAQNNQLDLSGLNAGTYVLHLSDPNGKPLYKQKILKIK
ncbi:MAG: FG-GAP-like repeat-containing protein [Reichenbachiella sp.]|uniref:FG-GAP-like repeat-containing protein n=1 Tax=Reichenbachiella sp. TaxID=2184521 RepID=UPI0029672D1D|nr:FG-GAP-like repeat-containing protein [Reichenbachiella sp.]MDW3210626.1 FG-GAP-like repeat-containing protein [Reichenbachiella sp.]